MTTTRVGRRTCNRGARFAAVITNVFFLKHRPDVGYMVLQMGTGRAQKVGKSELPSAWRIGLELE